MPILIDYNQFVIAAIFNSIKEGLTSSEVVDENTIRHLLLNQIRANRKKFFHEYGEVVICCDSKNTWRKDIFPYYKIRRNDMRKKNDLDWGKLFQTMEKLKNELKDHFPYKVIQVDKCEADDIIGTICNSYGEHFLIPEDRNFLILSRDKDFKQLLGYINVKMYDQKEKQFLSVANSKKFLKELIIRGDAGDDVPNILSSDSCFALKERQKMMTAPRFEKLMGQRYSEMEDDVRKNFDRNQTLIDFECIPEKLQTTILSEYEKESVNKRSGLMNYFMHNGLNNLLSDLGDF